MAFDFAHLTSKQIRQYMDLNATTQQKKDFVKVAHTMQKEKIGVEVLDENGKVVMYQVMDKNGKPKLDKHGNPMMRKKLEYVEKKNGEEERVFNLLKAKWWFAENFPDAVDNVPQRKEKQEKAGDIFADWFDL